MQGQMLLPIKIDLYVEVMGILIYGYQIALTDFAKSFQLCME